MLLSLFCNNIIWSLVYCSSTFFGIINIFGLNDYLSITDSIVVVELVANREGECGGCAKICSLWTTNRKLVSQVESTPLIYHGFFCIPIIFLVLSIRCVRQIRISPNNNYLLTVHETC